MLQNVYLGKESYQCCVIRVSIIVMKGYDFKASRLLFMPGNINGRCRPDACVLFIIYWIKGVKLSTCLPSESCIGKQHAFARRSTQRNPHTSYLPLIMSCLAKSCKRHLFHPSIYNDYFDVYLLWCLIVAQIKQSSIWETTIYYKIVSLCQVMPNGE